jgi:hypothetical protein
MHKKKHRSVVMQGRVCNRIVRTFTGYRIVISEAAWEQLPVLGDHDNA